MKIRCSLNVSEKVKENVKKYLENHNMGQRLVAVSHDTSDEKYIFIVMAEDTEVKDWIEPEYRFHVYTAWNESTHSLNCGSHQVSEKTALEILLGGVTRKFELIDGKPNEDRIEELCTKFKDFIFDNVDEYDCYEFLNNECELMSNECEWLGVNYNYLEHYDEMFDDDDET